jgi:hypothetical protein
MSTKLSSDLNKNDDEEFLSILLFTSSYIWVSINDISTRYYVNKCLFEQQKKKPLNHDFDVAALTATKPEKTTKKKEEVSEEEKRDDSKNNSNTN